MAQKENINQPKDLIEAVPEELDKIDVAKTLGEDAPIAIPMQRFSGREMREKEAEKRALEAWIPKTALGKEVKAGKIKDYDKAVALGRKILEPEIVDTLLKLESDLLLIGQAKGKFGGGKRRAWRQTQKKTMEGNVITFSSMAVVGDRKGHVGVGLGKAQETLPARAKALRLAKLNVITVQRGNETKDGGEAHTVPFIVEGKCGSVRIKFIPAPRGTGLVAGDEAKKILRLAGIKDIYTVADGQTRTTFNLAKAVVDALSKTNRMKI